MSKMRFRVLGGQHVDKDGKLYKRGDIVESYEDLDEKFERKFERLYGRDECSPAESKSVATKHKKKG